MLLCYADDQVWDDDLIACWGALPGSEAQSAIQGTKLHANTRRSPQARRDGGWQSRKSMYRYEKAGRFIEKPIEEIMLGRPYPSITPCVDESKGHYFAEFLPVRVASVDVPGNSGLLLQDEDIMKRRFISALLSPAFDSLSRSRDRTTAIRSHLEPRGVQSGPKPMRRVSCR